MVGCDHGKSPVDVRMQFGRTDLLEQFNWKRASRLISALVPE
jgi:hypothetical protein